MDQERLYDALRKAHQAGDTESAKKLADYIRSQGPAPAQPEKPFVVKAGEAINDIPRQIGLTARYALEGPAQAAQIVTEPVRQLITDPLSRMFGSQTRGKPLGQVATDLADSIGLPKPQSATERVVGDATRMGFGAAVPVGVGRLAQTTSTGVGQQVAKAVAANPMSQISAGAGAGFGSGASREAGGNEVAQVVGGALGAVAGGFAPGAIESVAKRISAMRASPMQLEGKITVALQESGVDFAQLPRNIREGLLSDVRRAMSAGDEVSPAALRRLADFRITNTTPTRGMVTLDPVQITREQNLAKMGANSPDGTLQGLARVQNQNNTRLIDNLNALGANQGDTLTAGETVTSTILGRQAALRNAEQAAWDAAKGSPGYRMPVSGRVLSDINGALGDEGLMPFMNPTISKYMEAFQTGQQPFTPQAYRNLQSMLSREVAKGGNEGAAASLAQRILAQADIAPAGFADAQNALVTQGTAAGMRAVDGAADDAISAVNQARRATRQAYAFEESSPLVRSVLSEGATSDPQRIAQRFIINGTANEAQDVLNQVGPQGSVVVKNAVLSHLKSAALSDASDEVGKFSQSAFNKALNKIGERKLSLIFTPEELTTLRANGRVASYMQVQPVGSAVNNSNSGALLAQKANEWLSMVPIAGPLIAPPIKSIGINLAQRQAQNVVPSLLTPTPRALGPGLLGPGVAVGGLLAAPGPDRP